jgi:hypothetical protein
MYVFLLQIECPSNLLYVHHKCSISNSYTRGGTHSSQLIQSSHRVIFKFVCLYVYEESSAMAHRVGFKSGR